MTILVTGSSGFIGTALVAELRRLGHRPVSLVRRRATGADEVSWDPSAGIIDVAALEAAAPEGLDAVVHLAGAGIGGRRWNEAYKRKLVDSRVGPTSLLAETLAKLERPPARLLSASAIGIYGDRGDETLTEASSLGTGFLPDLVQQWEAAADPAAAAGIRTILLRTGIVYSPAGGALRKLLPLFRLGIGGPMGNGRQQLSWISLDDEIGAVCHLLTADVEGPVNLTAPHPVTSAEQARILGKVLHRPARLAVPAFGPRLLLGTEMADALLFDSAKILPERLLESGYRFQHPSLDVALEAML